MGIIGLSAGLRYIAERGVANIYNHEMLLAGTLRDGLYSMTNVRTYCADRLDNHVALLTCNVRTSIRKTSRPSWTAIST